MSTRRHDPPSVSRWQVVTSRSSHSHVVRAAPPRDGRRMESQLNVTAIEMQSKHANAGNFEAEGSAQHGSDQHLSGGSDGRRSRDLTIFRRAVDAAACVCAQTRKRSTARRNRFSVAAARVPSRFNRVFSSVVGRESRASALPAPNWTGGIGRLLLGRVCLMGQSRTSSSTF